MCVRVAALHVWCACSCESLSLKPSPHQPTRRNAIFCNRTVQLQNNRLATHCHCSRWQSVMGNTLVTCCDSLQLSVDGFWCWVFQGSRDLAFICANFHFHRLVKRCLLGSSSATFVSVPHKPVLDDIDSKYGLHDYACTIELRNHKTSLWCQRFPNLFVKDGFSMCASTLALCHRQ